MNLDLPKIVDALLAISEWPWKQDERVGCIAVYGSDEDFNCLEIPKENFVVFWSGVNATDGWETRLKDRINSAFIAPSPVWLASLVVALVEEKANHLCWVNGKYGPLAEFIPTALRSFDLDPAKYAELKKRLENVKSEGK